MAEIETGGFGVQTYQYRQPSLTYRLNDETVAGKIDKIESVKQAISHILQTERFGSPLYSEDYGIELEQYLGKDIGFIKADIEETLRDALTQDDRITDVSVDSVEKSSEQNGACVVTFTVRTIFGDIEESASIG